MKRRLGRKGVLAFGLAVVASCADERFRSLEPSTGPTPNTSSGAASDGQSLTDATSLGSATSGVTHGTTSSDHTSSSTAESTGEASGCAYEIDLPGLVFEATTSEPKRMVTLEMPPGSEFARLELSVEIFHGGWMAEREDGIHNLVLLIRDGWGPGSYGGDTFGHLTARGPDRNLARATIIADVPMQDKTVIDGGVVLQEGAHYQLRYVYDAAAGVASMQIHESGGVLVFDVDVDVFAPLTTNLPTWEVILGDTAYEGWPHSQSVGWRWSNLSLCLND